MLRFSKTVCEEKYLIFKNILLVNMKTLKLINYSTDMYFVSWELS